MRECAAVYVRWVCVAWWVASARSAVVQTAQGALRGKAHGGHVSYLGIPYASVTYPAARFKRAGIAPTWSGVRESQPSRCSKSSGAEECLTLDVHVPTAGSPWPVLAWVRGGVGRYNPGKLVQQGIIVVVITHRLGPLGFLCLDDERIPGNAGVKDVVLALRWIRDNIPAFKGNPHKVVIGGQGFAAAMVEALLLTPMAEDLFHGAIMQSGSVLCPWAFNYDARERALTLGQMLANNDEAAVFMRADAGDLAEKSDKIQVPYIPFGMCVEKVFKREERLLSESPYRMLSNKFLRKVPLMVGSNSDEAYIFLSLLKQRRLLKRTAKDMSMLLPEELKFFNEAELKNVVKQIHDFYFNNNFSIAALLAYHRDAYFTNHIARSVKLHAASHLPVYYYQFSHAGEPGVQPDYGVPKTGAAHSDELAYLFPESVRDMDGDDGIVQQHLITLWTNFVKHLMPTPNATPMSWEPTDASDPRLLTIATELKMTDVSTKMSNMWGDISDRFYYARIAGH